MKKEPGAYWSDAEIKQALDEWKKKKPEKQKTGDWRVEDVPFYEKGRVPRLDLWNRVEFQDEVEIIWGKPWGASGIGKLREVALCRPCEYDIHIYEKQDPGFMNRPTVPDMEGWQKDHDNYAKILRENGVKVNYIEYPKPPIGGYGPIRGCWATCEAKVIWGGAIITKYGGYSPLSRGREVVMTKYLASQGCPILHTVIGKGVLDAGPTVYITDDCISIHTGACGNKDGIEQVRPVFERAGITSILEVEMPGWLERNPQVGRASVHLDMVIASVDVGKVLIDASLCGWTAVQWLMDNRFELITVDPDEAPLYPANVTVLEPGKIIMVNTSKKTIAKVRKAGIEVIDIPFSEALHAGGGIDCATLQMIRDRGPKLADMK